MPQNTLKDDDLLIKAFGRDKAAVDVANNMAVAPSKENIQKVLAALDAQGGQFSGKLGTMQPVTTKGPVTKAKQVAVTATAEPE